ncbi:hypothetical protein Taro_044910 [Colocasia esculenta]|uniref:Uncharacterized protein n=1 Tax=Colocasia esculenta TaxID=4460 RepID=A0A843X3F9_COLES|nr:hypothetical protein [Colocasia esculenta]
MLLTKAEEGSSSMNIKMKDISAYTKKTIVFSIVIIYRSAREHPFVLGMVSFLLLMYRFLPHLFGFLVSSSPIIICTAVLLGVLLSFGQPNIPEIEEQETAHAPSPPQSRAIVNDLIMEEDESFSIGRHVDNREKVEQVEHGSKSERGTLSSASNEEEEKEPGASVGAGLPIEVDKKQMDIENIATNKRAIESIEHPEKAEIHEANLLSSELADHTFLATSVQKEIEVLKVENHEPLVEGQFDSSVASSWKITDHHDASDSDSDRAESSSPDASMADIIPMLYELHPLLDAEDPHPVNASMDDLHSMSGASTEDDGSGEEAENQGEGGEEEEEEAKEEHEDGAALAVKWTEDDAKNLLVLGTSELERNQRLENLIAKRRARKNLSVEMNLIDLDVHETLPMVDELSRIQMQIPPLSTSKRNPFDLPYDSDPIPGSAPSVLLPRRNPFDLPLDITDGSGGLMGVSHQGSVAVPQRDMFFRRHESFALGASFPEFKQEKHDVKLRPYFVTERTDVEESSYAHLERQMSEKSDSKVSSVLESESVSSAADQDYEDELPEHQLHQESEFERVPTSVNDDEHGEREGKFAVEGDSIDPLCRHNEVNIHSSHDTIPSTVVLGASIHDFIKHEEQNRDDLELCSPTSEAAKSDTAEEKYSRSSSSCSSEMSMKNLSTKSEGSTDHQIPSGHSAKGSSDSVQSISVEVEIVNDRHAVEPVYDSSPSAAEKYLSNTPSLEEELLHGEKGSLKSTSSLSSETPIEASGIGSPSVISERNTVSVSVSGSGSMGEMSAFNNGELWVAPSNLSSVEEIESRSREVEVIREQDVIQVEFTEANDEYDHPTVSSLPESPTEQAMCYSLSSESDSSEDTATDMGVDLQFSKKENVVVAPHSDVPGMSTFSLQVQANAETPVESWTVQASFDTSLPGQVQANAETPVESSTVQASFDTSLPEQVKLPENGDASTLLPGVHIPDSTFDGTEISRQVGGIELPVLSESIEIIEAEWSKWSTDSKDEVLNKQENVLLEGVHDPGVPFGVHAGIEQIKSIDDEALLLELDAIGDFHVEEMRLSDSRNQTIYHYEITEKNVSEESSYVKSETVESEVLLSEAHSNSRDLQEVEARSVEDIHVALKRVSEGTTGNPPKPLDTKCILEQQEAEARTFEDLHIQVSGGTLEAPSRRSGVSYLQYVETRPVEDRDMASEHLECTNDCPPKLTENENNSSVIEAALTHVKASPKRTEIADTSHMEELEARSVADIDLALKYECEGNMKDGCIEVEATEQNLEHSVLEAQTSENIKLAGAVSK